MDSKLSPLQIVAREMAAHSTMTRDQVEEALEAVLIHLMRRAEASIRASVPDAAEAMSLAQQYQAVSEAVFFLGSQLIAFEDIEADDDPDDDWEPKN